MEARVPVSIVANRSPEHGGVMIAVLMVLMPLVLILGALTTTMTARTMRLGQDVSDERALLAAESGVDQALFESRRGNLVSGVAIARTVGAMSFTATPTYLGSDGKDNDGDGVADVPADPDEDVFQLISVGTFNGTTRRIAAYIGKTSWMPIVQSAVLASNPALDIRISGSPWVDGRNHRLDGSLVGSGDTFGIGVTPPATTASVLGSMTAGEQARINGIGGPPSVGPAPPVDIPSLVNNARNAATYSLTNNRYTSLPAGPSVYYRAGDLALSGNIAGSGLLVVTGDLRITGRVSFKGVIVVLGELENSAGTMEIMGGLLTGDSSSNFRIGGTADIKYSSEAVDLANKAAGRYVAFNGWQELSRK